MLSLIIGVNNLTEPLCADFFFENYPDLKGFTRRGLYRTKQFYELYMDDEKVSTLLTQLN